MAAIRGEKEPPSGFPMTRPANLNIGPQSPKPYLPRIDSSVSNPPNFQSETLSALSSRSGGHSPGPATPQDGQPLQTPPTPKTRPTLDRNLEYNKDLPSPFGSPPGVTSGRDSPTIPSTDYYGSRPSPTLPIPLQYSSPMPPLPPPSPTGLGGGKNLLAKLSAIASGPFGVRRGSQDTQSTSPTTRNISLPFPQRKDSRAYSNSIEPLQEAAAAIGPPRDLRNSQSSQKSQEEKSRSPTTAVPPSPLGSVPEVPLPEIPSKSSSITGRRKPPHPELGLPRTPSQYRKNRTASGTSDAARPSSHQTRPSVASVDIDLRDSQQQPMKRKPLPVDSPLSEASTTSSGFSHRTTSSRSSPPASERMSGPRSMDPKAFNHEEDQRINTMMSDLSLDRRLSEVQMQRQPSLEPVRGPTPNRQDSYERRPSINPQPGHERHPSTHHERRPSGYNPMDRGPSPRPPSHQSHRSHSRQDSLEPPRSYSRGPSPNPYDRRPSVSPNPSHDRKPSGHHHERRPSGYGYERGPSPRPPSLEPRDRRPLRLSTEEAVLYDPSHRHSPIQAYLPNEPELVRRTSQSSSHYPGSEAGGGGTRLSDSAGPLPPIPRVPSAMGHKRSQTSKGPCRGCGEQIFGKSISSADGRLTGRYHKPCFECGQILGDDYFEVNGRPYCESHARRFMRPPPNMRPPLPSPNYRSNSRGGPPGPPGPPPPNFRGGRTGGYPPQSPGPGPYKPGSPGSGGYGSPRASPRGPGGLKIPGQMQMEEQSWSDMPKVERRRTRMMFIDGMEIPQVPGMGSRYHNVAV
ncbi:hypothetical protein BZA77DRAFT_349670 [Pyronema omphalodes]|nr:hypothetical protein BZA77DRAFT_349670 [Pyronema omphalodes]